VGTGAGIDDIRGVGSFTLRLDPLIYADVVRVNNDSQSEPMIADSREANPLDDFNPQDIESIEIIKGPAAATLYVTEASAGVIHIITKRGREGAPQFEMSVRRGPTGTV
jgi:outer membrane receptor for ferrienterochelin and colicin